VISQAALRKKDDNDSWERESVLIQYLTIIMVRHSKRKRKKDKIEFRKLMIRRFEKASLRNLFFLFVQMFLA